LPMKEQFILILKIRTNSEFVKLNENDSLITTTKEVANNFRMITSKPLEGQVHQFLQVQVPPVHSLQFLLQNPSLVLSP